MCPLHNPPAKDLVSLYEETVYRHVKYTNNTFLLTKAIYTFCNTPLTKYDIHRYIELGLGIIRFSMRDLTPSDIIKVNQIIHKAVTWFCKKYHVPSWPIALSADILNVCIRTGFLDQSIEERSILIKENDIITLTCDKQYFNKCNANIIYMDDPHTFAIVKPGTEICIRFENIMMTCKELIDENNMKCKVIVGNELRSYEMINFRNVKHLKPELPKRDLDILNIATECQFDFFIINCCQNASIIHEVRKMNKDTAPLLIAAICEQEGLDNLYEIVKASDGILIGNEFLFAELENFYKVPMVQMKVTAVCKKNRKAVFASGNVLQNVLYSGKASSLAEMNDINNLICNGCGIVVRGFDNTDYLTEAMITIDEVCKAVESLNKDDVWGLYDEFKMPVNAAEACVIACSLMAIMRGAHVIIVCTATGKTVSQLFYLSPNICIIAVTSKHKIARQLQMYRGVNVVIHEKKPSLTWNEDMNDRIETAINYGLKFEFLNYNDNCVVLKKNSPSSSYCDQLYTTNIQKTDTDTYNKTDLLDLSLGEYGIQKVYVSRL